MPQPSPRPSLLVTNESHSLTVSPTWNPRAATFSSQLLVLVQFIRFGLAGELSNLGGVAEVLEPSADLCGHSGATGDNDEGRLCLEKRHKVLDYCLPHLPNSDCLSSAKGLGISGL